MGRGKEDFFASTIESGNWNIADLYSKVKIAKHLAEIDEYIKIALFGTAELIDEFTTSEEVKDMAKLKALHRLHEELKMVIDNTKFAVKQKDKHLLTGYEKVLDEIQPHLFNCTRKQKKVTIKGNVEITKINEPLFNDILKMLRKVHKELLIPLNRADLIFTSIDEFDPIKHKEEMMRQLIEEG